MQLKNENKVTLIFQEGGKCRDCFFIKECHHGIFPCSKLNRKDKKDGNWIAK